MTTRNFPLASPAVRWLMGGIVVVLVVALGVQTVSLAFARRYAEKQPERALAWREGHPRALSRLAEDAGARAATPGDMERVAALARQALAAAPLDVRALRTLGFAADRQGQDKRAAALMALAGARSLRDSRTQLWLFDRKVARRDYPGALSHVGALMRQAALRPMLSAVLVSLAGDGEAADALVAAMARNPPWRPYVIGELARSGDPAMAYDMLSRLQESGSPPSEAEAGTVVRGLEAKGRIPEAYLAWVLMLPPEGLERLTDIYDSDFDGLPGSAPFNWSLAQSSGQVTTEIAEGPAGGGALFVRASGARKRWLARQTLVLTPGDYRLSVEATVQSGSNPLRWSLACFGREVAAVELTSDNGAVQADFTIPDACVSQSLQLQGTPGPQGVEAWIDRVAVQRLARPQS